MTGEPSTAEERIAAAFNARFGRFDIGIRPRCIRGRRARGADDRYGCDDESKQSSPPLPIPPKTPNSSASVHHRLIPRARSICALPQTFSELP